MKRLLLCLICICLIVMSLPSETLRHDVSVYFRNDVDSIELAYNGNRERLAHLDSIFHVISEGRGVLQDVTTHFRITGWASPPATVSYNAALSQRRANALKDWLVRHCNVAADSIESVRNGVNYPLLARLVKERNYRYADEVLAIIKREPKAGEADHRRERLLHLHDGSVWNDLSADYFPELRRADITVEYTVPEVPQAEEQPPVSLLADTVQEVAPQPIPQPEVPASHRSVYWSLHTNLLADAMLIPNIGAEAYLGKNFSVAANWWYAWWKTDRRHYYWRTYGGYIAPRYWFGKAAHHKPLTGHHIGIYAQALLYDFEFGGKGYLSGTPGRNIFHHPSIAAGVEYGFSLPIRSRLNLDFTIGAGYLTGRYWTYVPNDDGYSWISRQTRHWFGPTKLEVSLVWLLGPDNRNAKKGGER